MHFLDLMVFALVIGVPVVIAVEFFCLVSNKRDKEEKVSRARMKREISRKRHPSNDEG